MMQQSDGAVNPQETVSEAEMGWLAGVIDGEGCMHIDLEPRNGAHPYLTITNSNFVLAEKVAGIWHRLGVGCRIQTRKRHNPRHSPVKDVMVIGYRRLEKALAAILPYLVAKQDEGLLLQEFIQSRLRVGPSPCSDGELKLIRALKAQKSCNRILTDHTPNGQQAEEMVGTLQRCKEAGRNDQPRLIGE